MTEVPIPTSALIDINPSIVSAPQPYTRRSFEIPQHLRGSPEGNLGRERGDFMERRVQAILSAQLEVKAVFRNKINSEQDGKTHDLTVIFVDELGIQPIHIQVKSNRFHFYEYYRRIRGKLRKSGSDLTPAEWLIMDRTIPINGSKPTEGILISFADRVAEILDRGPELSAARKYVPLFKRKVSQAA